MSAFSSEGNATLGQIIKHLSLLPSDMPVAHGFDSPHSYRGYYEDLAFEPKDDTTVGEMLACAKMALGKTFQGYKGGEYTMLDHTDCWLAEYGDTGIAIVVPDFESKPVYFLPKPE